jgi:ubiquinol-cytochrome c reductase cytochrome b subunit
MLKLGDKTLMGIIIPTVLALVLIGLPYFDRNPARSLYKRPFAVGAGILAVCALAVLTYMGGPSYGIKTDPSARIVQDLAPVEGVGQLRAVPYEQLVPGTYIVNETPTFNMCPELDYGCPEFEAVFSNYSDLVNEAAASGDLPNASGVMVIEEWQPGTLKKVTMRISYQKEGQDLTFAKDIFIHIDRTPANQK